MMALTSITLLKAQLNLDHDLDDALLLHKLDAAETWAASFIGAALADPVPAPVTEAVLQLAAHWYENREAVAYGGSGAPIPFGVVELLRPYRDEVTGHVAA
ncbi:head-tail connector protein [Mameliella sp. AT18]|uniref:head-tail connector protein n=1 Tax=Mameliella sp. AT18 TaxID=3028385 RepID=UPI00237B9E85|nr:head-tail connector protein [Mameliella sp. AT18]MDD9730452.1 head-tail connector protein [Mameliella sp. AT18]